MIVKPNQMSRGKGISLHITEETFKTVTYGIAQTYVMNPLLIREKKYGLRIFVVITNLDPLQVYVYTDGITKMCGEKYTNDPEKLTKLPIHLNNHNI